MKPIAIYGAGGLGRETLWMIRQINHQKKIWNIVGFFDDYIPKGTCVGGVEMVGTIDQARVFSGSLVLAIADPWVRKKIYEQLRAIDTIDYPVLIHPSCQLGDEATHSIGQGCIIAASTVLTIHITLGMFSIVNVATTVGHDTVLEDYVTLMPGCSVSGNVLVGEGTTLGVGSRIVQHITLGNACQVGAGAVVIKSFPAGSMLTGVPAEVRKKK